MGIIDRKAEELAIKLIAQYTGMSVKAKVCIPCEATIEPGWKGYCVLTEEGLFLVNKHGARGIGYGQIGGTESWGQYPKGTKGYPTYRFQFLFTERPGGFVVFSKTEAGGKEMENYLDTLYKDV